MLLSDCSVRTGAGVGVGEGLSEGMAAGFELCASRQPAAKRIMKTNGMAQQISGARRMAMNKL